VLQAVIFFALSRDARRRSKPYLIGLTAIALALLNLILATCWHAPPRAGLYALAPAWLWLSVDASGAWRDAPGRKTFLVAAAAPALVLGLLALTNPWHGLHWATYGFQGRIFVITPGPAARLGSWHGYAALAVGSIFWIISLKRHHGAERVRLALLGLAFALVAIGDALWTHGVALPIGMNPLSVCSTLAAYVSGVAYLRYGLPRASAPLREQDLRRQAEPLSAREDSAGDEPRDAPYEQAERDLDRLMAEAGLSERQRTIALCVAEGLAYKVVASRVGITERTVKYHMAQILDKLGLETREQLIALVALQGASRD